MAVLIASNLRKEIAGAPLFDGVSFKVERRDRLALAGPNGAGKTTLLRALTGEVSLEGGELAWEKGTRVALHDQRPPATSARPLRDYVLAGTADLVALEAELRELEAEMAGGAHDRRTLSRYAAAQGRLEHAGGYDWRDRAASVVRGLGFSDADLDRPLSTFSGGELTRASLARALASQPDLLLLDEPTNHLDIETLEWLEGMLATIDAGVILVAHDRWFLEAVTTAVLELDRGALGLLPGQVARVAPRAGGAGAARGASGRARRGEDRPARAVRRAVRREEHEGEAGEVEAEADRPAQGGTPIGGLSPAPRRALGFEFLKPARTGRVVVEAEGLGLRAGEKELLEDASFALERGEHVALVGPNGAGKTTLLETILGRREPAVGKVKLGHGVVPAYFSQHEAELDERGSVLDAAVAATGLRRPEAQKLLGQVPVLRLGGAREARRRRCRAASGAGSRSPSSSRAARTCSSSTSRRTTSTSRAARRSSRRSARSPARCSSSPTTGRSSTRYRAACSRSRTGASSPTRAAGPSTWPAATPSPPSRSRRSRRRRGRRAERPKGPTPIELVEREIARTEERIADLERQIADDWTNIDLVNAHRAARDDLTALLARWEDLFEQAQA